LNQEQTVDGVGGTNCAVRSAKIAAHLGLGELDPEWRRLPSENYPRFFDCFLTTGRPGFSRFAARSAPPGVL
jgi:hypothetical protein